MMRNSYPFAVTLALAVCLTAPHLSAQTSTPANPAGQNGAGQTAASQSPAPPAGAEVTPSLGEIARKLRAEKSRETAKASVVYTNENLPSGGGISVTGPAPGAPGAVGEGGAAGLGGKPAPAGAHGEAYFRGKMAELQNRLQTDQRELSVLKQKLSQNSMAYYPDPYKTLMQEYTRSDINNGASQVDQKQKQIEADQQAINDLQVQLRQEGGEPSWLSPSAGAPAAAPGGQGAGISAKPGTPDYLAQRLTEAKKALTNAEEQQRVAEDELGLLQLQQARELDQTMQEQLTAKIAAKKQEIQKWKDTVEQARKQVEDLQKQASQKPAAH